MTDYTKVEQTMQLYAHAKRQGRIGIISAGVPVIGCWHCGAFIRPGKVCETCYAMPPKDR